MSLGKSKKSYVRSVKYHIIKISISESDIGSHPDRSRHIFKEVTAINTEFIPPSPKLAEKIRCAPLEPGCYLFKDASGYVIYVGKGKNIRSRVRQYFQASRHTDQRDKVTKLVRVTTDVEFVITGSELDALLLEYRLIKQYKPWFNSQLKRETIHPYLRIDAAGPYKALSISNRHPEASARYYGGFYDSDEVSEALNLLHQVWKTPVCKKSSYSPGSRACLQYHLGNCLAPCSGNADPEAYERTIRAVSRFLDGSRTIFGRLEKQMLKSAAALEFEQAAACRELIAKLERLQRKCQKMYHFPPDRDVILLIRAYRSDEFSIFYIKKGSAAARQTFKNRLNQECLEALLSQIREGAALPDNMIPNQTLPHYLNPDRGRLENGLTEIYADKLFLVVPRRADEDKITDIIKSGAARFAGQPQDPA